MRQSGGSGGSVVGGRRIGGHRDRRVLTRSPAVALTLAGVPLAWVALSLPHLPSAAAGGDSPAWGSPLSAPPAVARPFAPPESRFGSGHRGVDLSGPPGGPVLAAGAGRVSYAGLLAGRPVVVVSHGELRTTYEPVSPTVAVDQSVNAGERIGTLEPGHPGCSTPACLHWGLRQGEQYLDPLSLLGRTPVRLLPVIGPLGVPGPLPPAAAGSPPASGGGSQADSAMPPVGANDLPTAPPPVAGWDLRAAVTRDGALALAALLAGLTLLIRPRRPAGRPPTAAAAAGTAPTPVGPDRDSRPGSGRRPVPAVAPGPDPGVIDLRLERARRRLAGNAEAATGPGPGVTAPPAGR